MKKSFTLIELIFVIVIIGLLASFAVPKFLQTKMSASVASAKSLVSSVRTEIGNKHGEWMINSCGENNGFTPQGYPRILDDTTAGAQRVYLFVGNTTFPLLKTGIKSCASSSDYSCWVKYKNNDLENNVSYYSYRLTLESNITLDYNGSNGEFKCNNDSKNSGSDLNSSQCAAMIDG